MLYFDHNATTPVRPDVLEAVDRTQRDVFGNPSSLHACGRQARALLEESRERLAAVLGIEPVELIFTSGGTESNRLAFGGALTAARASRRGTEALHLLLAGIEHPSVLEVGAAYASKGLKVDLVPPGESGVVDAASFASRLGPETCFVSLQHANNETGVVQPVEALSRALSRWRQRQEAMALAFHVDAVQTLGKARLRPSDLGADLVSISSHKVGGPKGAGALWVRSGAAFASPSRGGPQERRMRPGTENLPAIVGFALAAELACEAQPASGEGAAVAGEASTPSGGVSVHGLEAALRQRIEGVTIHGAGVPRLANTLNVAFRGVPAELLVIRLDQAGFAVSTGSACASGSREPSHVLRAMGVEEVAAREAIRVSTGWSNRPGELDRLAEAIADAVQAVREALASG